MKTRVLLLGACAVALAFVVLWRVTSSAEPTPRPTPAPLRSGQSAPPGPPSPAVDPGAVTRSAVQGSAEPALPPASASVSATRATVGGLLQRCSDPTLGYKLWGYYDPSRSGGDLHPFDTGTPDQRRWTNGFEVIPNAQYQAKLAAAGCPAR